MATVFKIVNLERRTADGFITTAHWTATKTQDRYTASGYGSVGFAKTASVNTTPFEQITEEMVVEWVKGVMGEEAVTQLETTLSQNIELQKNPVAVTGLPWSAA